MILFFLQLFLDHLRKYVHICFHTSLIKLFITLTCSLVGGLCLLVFKWNAKWSGVDIDYLALKLLAKFIVWGCQLNFLKMSPIYVFFFFFYLPGYQWSSIVSVGRKIIRPMSMIITNNVKLFYPGNQVMRWSK